MPNFDRTLHVRYRSEVRLRRQSSDHGLRRASHSSGSRHSDRPAAPALLPAGLVDVVGAQQAASCYESTEHLRSEHTGGSGAGTHRGAVTACLEERRSHVRSWRKPSIQVSIPVRPPGSRSTSFESQPYPGDRLPHRFIVLVMREGLVVHLVDDEGQRPTCPRLGALVAKNKMEFSTRVSSPGSTRTVVFSRR